MAGWGRSTWGSGPWGQPAVVNVTVNLTGVAGTSALGTETVSCDANITETGVYCTGSVGSLTATGQL